MNVRRTALAFALALAMTGLFGPSGFAATMLKVSLWNKAGAMEMDLSRSMGLGMGMHGNLKSAMMGIKTGRKTVPSGTITLDAKNLSKDTVHELLIAPITGTSTRLPYVAKENRVDEDAAHVLGEVSDLDPGKSGRLTLDLKPGLYVLFCNIPGHYMAGMWTTIRVQ